MYACYQTPVKKEKNLSQYINIKTLNQIIGIFLLI